MVRCCLRADRPRRLSVCRREIPRVFYRLFQDHHRSRGRVRPDSVASGRRKTDGGFADHARCNRLPGPWINSLVAARRPDGSKSIGKQPWLLSDLEHKRDPWHADHDRRDGCCRLRPVRTGPVLVWWVGVFHRYRHGPDGPLPRRSGQNRHHRPRHSLAPSRAALWPTSSLPASSQSR